MVDWVQSAVGRQAGEVANVTRNVDYRVLDHTADFAFEALGRDFPDLVAACLLACSDAMWGLESLRPVEDAEFAIAPGDREMALFLALSEWVFLVEARGLIPAAVTVEEAPDGGWTARLECDRHDPARHAHRVAIKAPTLHGLKVTRTRGGGLRARVIMDT